MYDLEYLRVVIRNVIDNRGIAYKEDGSELDMDSLQFISMIIEFEELLNISINDNYLSFEHFSSFLSIENTLAAIISMHEDY